MIEIAAIIFAIYLAWIMSFGYYPLYIRIYGWTVMMIPIPAKP
jgi:hypothetical protein